MGWLDEAEAPARKGQDFPPIDPDTVLTARPALLEKGAKLFKQNCSACHGDAGHGDGPAAFSLNPRPRNFALPEKWKRGYRVTDIFTTITMGIANSGMAPFDFIRPVDRMALVHYVRSLGAFDHGPENAQALEALANQFRSKGYREPNRIPVRLAVQKLIREQTPLAPLSLPSTEDASHAAQLLRAVVADPGRVTRTVAAAASKHGDVVSVARAWAAGAPSNGFSPAVATLDAQDWQTLVAALLELAPTPKAEEAKQP
jgi:mono/diheme cytochrome c family protein